MTDPAPDALLGGRLHLLQARSGHRAGTDALLLAAAAASNAATRFVDVGAGVGTAGLALARWRPALCGLLLEADPAAADLARRNCALNDVADRIGVVEADLFSGVDCRRAGLDPERADLVLTNPPFYRAGAVRASPDAGRAAAHVMARSPADWIVAAAALLAPKGRLVLIHRPEALPVLFIAAEGRLGAVAVRPIHARPGTEAIRVIVSGMKGSRAPLRLLPGLTLHAADGRFTAEAEAIHRGEEVIET